MITIRKCSIDDVNELQKISSISFRITYEKLNSEDNIKSYLENAYGYEKLKKELLSDHSFFFFIYYDSTLAGYCKVNESMEQTELHDPESLELERIYVLEQFHSRGLGRHLMNQAIEVASCGGKQYLWLGVWEKNMKAIAFYKKFGFYEFGQHPFLLGDEEQTDYLLRKDLY